MILKLSILALILSAAWLKDVSGASYSKVYVHSGSEVVPVEYVQYDYGAPSVSLASPHLAAISAAPVGSVVPVSSVPNVVAPCGTPCVYPGQTVAAVAPAAPNYITYKSNVPIVVQNNNEPAPGYEYSYVVYDENTGDHKAQRELSDGSVVRGEYSLIQPDGYVREVQYIADDLNGFNAIVKNFLPVTVEKKIDHVEKNQPAPPCIETKSEQLKAPADHEGHEHAEIKVEQSTSPEGHEGHEHLDTESLHEESKENIHSEDTTVVSHEMPEDKTPEISSEVTHEKLTSESQESSHEETPEISHEDSSHEMLSEEGEHEKQSEALTDLTTESHEETSSEQPEETTHEVQAETPAHEEQESEPSQDEHKEETTEELKVTPEEHTEAVAHEILETSAVQEIGEPNILVPYNDILKCIQSAVKGVTEVPAGHTPQSPLTYIILNKPC